MSSKKPFDIKKPIGRRRGRKPKNANRVTNEFSGMFVLPPNILQKLGINLNIANVENAQPATTSFKDSENENSVSSSAKHTEPDTTKHMQPSDVVAVSSESTDSSILETANLMKTSVFLSPTFNPVSANIVNAEIEFLSLNQGETGDAETIEKQSSDEPSFFITPTCKDNTAMDTQEVADTTIDEKINHTQVRTDSVQQESQNADVEDHLQIIEILRKKIQNTIHSVLAEEAHNAEDKSDGSDAGCYNNADNHVDQANRKDTLNDPFPVYLEKTTLDKSTGNIGAFIKQTDLRLADENDLNYVASDKIIVNSECITTSKQSTKHSLVTDAERQSYATGMLPQHDTFDDAKVKQNVKDLFSNEDYHSQMIENLKQVTTSDIVLTNKNEERCQTELFEVSMPRISSACFQQKEDSEFKFNSIARKEKTELNILGKAENANVVFDDHLDEAYLSDCSNSNLGSSGNAMSAQEPFDPPSSDSKNSKISILSEEIIEPSRFGKICGIAKISHQSESLIPVSVNTVVFVNHKNIYTESKNKIPRSLKINKNCEQKSTLDSNFYDNKPILFDKVDGSLPQTPDNVTHNQQAAGDQLITETQISTEEKTSEIELVPPSPGKSNDNISDKFNLALNDVANTEKLTNATKPKEKVEEIASYLAKFAHILTNRKKDAKNKTGKNIRTIKKCITNSRSKKEGVEKPGGSDNIDASQKEEDESQCPNVWRTYRISQKLPSRLNYNWDIHTAVNFTHEDNINLPELTAVDDIDLDFNLCDDFGSLCYHESPEDLDIDENHLNENTNNIPARFYIEQFRCVASTVQTEENVAVMGKIEPKEESFIERTETEDLRRNSLEQFLVDQLATSDLSGILASEYAEPQNSYIGYRIEDDFLTENNRPSIRLSMFDNVVNDVNVVINNTDKHLKDDELDLDDQSFEEVCKYFDFEANSLFDVETIAGCGQTQSNVNDDSYKIPSEIKTAKEATTSKMKRRHSDIKNEKYKSNVTKDETTSSSENVITCGVCQESLVGDNKWNEHLSNEHCYIAWKDGENIDLKSNKLLSNLNIRLKFSPPLKCTFCFAEYKTCKKFLSHIRQCLEKYESSKKANKTRCICAVCHEKVDSDKWFEHIKNIHNYIAWREGEPSIGLEQDVKRLLDSVLMLHGCLKCSECDASFKRADSFNIHIKTCRVSSPNHQEEIMRRQSSSSESDMKIGDLKGILDSGRKRLLRNSQKSPEPSKHTPENIEIRRSHPKNLETATTLSNERKATASCSSTQELCGDSTRSSCTLNRLSSTATIDKSEDYLPNTHKKIGSVKTLLPQTLELRDPATNNIPETIKKDKPVTETETKKCNLDEPKNSKVDGSKKLGSINPNIPTSSSRKRSRLVSTEIDSIDQSQEPNRHNTEDTNTLSDKPSKRSQKRTSHKTQKYDKQKLAASEAFGRELKETKEPETKNKRKCTGEKHNKHVDSVQNYLVSEDFQSGLNNLKKKLSPKDQTSNISGNVKKTKDKTQKTDVEVTTKNEQRLTHAKKTSSDIGKGSNTSSIVKKDSENGLCQVEAQNEVPNKWPSNLKAEPEVDSGSTVECGVCQEKVESNAWISHSQTKHQYLAWQTGQTALDIKDDTEVLEHLKIMTKQEGCLICSKCGLTRKYAKKFLTHIRTCDPVEVPIKPETALETSLDSTGKREQNCDFDISSVTAVTCAVCNKTVKSETWRDHAFSEHYNIAWPVGGDPIDVRSTWQIEKVLKAYKLICKQLVCNVCGASRVSPLGFYAHILACGKTEEEIDKFKDVCNICNQKYLCIYRQQHFMFHSKQQISIEQKQIKAEIKEKIKLEKANEKETLNRGGQRKAAQKAMEFFKGQYEHQCPNCDFGTDCRRELENHKCSGTQYGELEDTAGRSDEESECSDVDSDSSDDDDLPKKRIRKKKPSEYKKRILKVPFVVRDIKNYIKKSYIDFCNVHFACDRLFVDWVPSTAEEIPNALIKPYLPTLEESCKVQERDGWTTFKKFEARFDQVVTFFTGAAPQCVSWAPPVYNPAAVDASGNLLAVACHSGADVPRLDSDRCYTHKGLLQIWDFGLFDGSLPSLVLGIAHEHGAIWAMDWCPSGARDPLPASPAGALARLGLLAIACSDGAAYVLSVPYPSTLPDGGRFFKLKPVVELRFDDRKQFQCTSIKWSAQKGHATIAVGYSNGAVAFYNLNGGSPLGQSEEDGVWILYPYYDERIHNVCVTGVDLFPSTEECTDSGLAAASSSTGVALWAARGATVARTNVHLPSSGALFQPHWPSVLCMAEDPLAVSEVEWDGWRGRTGSRLAAACARRGLVACAASPLVRLALMHRLHTDQPRKTLAAIEMKPLSSKRKKARENTKFEMKVEPLTYEKAITTYGLQLTLLKRERTAWQKTNETRPERFPLSEVAAMAFCPHPKYHNNLIVATHTGIVFVLNADTHKLYSRDAKKL